MLPSFLSAHVLSALQRESNRLSALEHQVEDWHERGAEKWIITQVSSNRGPLDASNLGSFVFVVCRCCTSVWCAGYVVESMPSGVLDDHDPARFCARAYAAARGASIVQRCSNDSNNSSNDASTMTDQLVQTIAADNAAVCDLLFRNTSLLKIVHALLEQRAAAGSVEPQTGAKRKASSCGMSGDASSSGVDSTGSSSLPRPHVWLFNEQYISKPPRTQLAQFGWVNHTIDRCAHHAWQMVRHECPSLN